MYLNWEGRNLCFLQIYTILCFLQIFFAYENNKRLPRVATAVCNSSMYFIVLSDRMSALQGVILIFAPCLGGS